MGQEGIELLKEASKIIRTQRRDMLFYYLIGICHGVVLMILLN